jgi:hypothetical protein
MVADTSRCVNDMYLRLPDGVCPDFVPAPCHCEPLRDKLPRDDRFLSLAKVCFFELTCATRDCISRKYRNLYFSHRAHRELREYWFRCFCLGGLCGLA